ncbi:hypothetical protein BS47DRAFT_769601 [Hydnum rufescens UP504]|uniref:Uncharacterized protein n=1 Tax=Hydnum rufescens UP504 TaxID=1448309 RepID=A0A9P6B0U1_9AGAM|nr:hypothetical protein BS47DRAFT_769601 [Hydnum rufescens UP504]
MHMISTSPVPEDEITAVRVVQEKTQYCFKGFPPRPRQLEANGPSANTVVLRP